MQAVPACRLEGDATTTTPPITTNTTSTTGGHQFQEPLCYIPACPRLDANVRILHSLARTGAISADTAERQINTFLLLPSASESLHVRKGGVPLKWFMLPLPDAPHHSLMPDLGHIIHRVLAQDPVACALSAVVEQCIPRFRHASPGILYTDSQTQLLSLVTGLLLGLYPGNVKKPRFAIRSALYASIHSLLTSPPEQQTVFCKENEDILLLACMEYMARVPPIHMPVQHSALLDGDPTTQGFYRRIHPICDELRQWLDEGESAPPAWPAIRCACRTRVEQLSRLKRAAGVPAALSTVPGWRKTLQPSTATAHPKNTSLHHQQRGGLGCLGAEELKACWHTPLLPSGGSDEYRLLGLALSLPGDVIQQVQRETQVFPLPGNLRRMQQESLASTGRARMRASFLQSRWYICMQCMVHHKSQHHRTRLRLDTLTHRLVCATCLTEDPVAINMVGRVLQYHHTHYYLCPTCITIQPYQGQKEQPWTSGGCSHQVGDTKRRGSGPDPKPPKRKEACCICLEHALVQTALRVDHLTGEMQEFHYCQRHAPRSETARMCVNARQMASFAGRQKKRDYY
jgi:hypothetical protein